VGDDKLPQTVQISEFYSMNTDGSDSKQLTKDNNNIGFMRYLPKSDKILFTEVGGIYIMNSDGTQRQLLSNQIGSGFTITQDEHTAYFVTSSVSGLKANSVLYSFSLSTGQEKQILQDSSGIEQLGLSMDGSELMYNSISLAPKNSTLYLLNTATLEKRMIKEGVNLYCSFPQFIPNSNQVLLFDKIDSNQNDTYLRIIDLADTSQNRILDTVTIQGDVYFALSSKGDIFYEKNGITVLNIYSTHKKTIPFLFYPSTIADNINWSYDETELIFTNNLNNQIVRYNLSSDISTSIRPTQAGQGGITIYPFNYPFLNYNNSKIFYTVRSIKTTFI
jgi:hypothetical protein